MRGCITLIVLIGSAMVAITYLGVWFLVLCVAALAYLALAGVGRALGWIGREWEDDCITVPERLPEADGQDYVGAGVVGGSARSGSGSAESGDR